MNENLRLTGQTVTLRRMTRDDAQNVVRWRSDPEVAAQMFSEPPTLERHLQWFDRSSGSDSRSDFIICVHSTGEETPVGTIGLSAIDLRHSRAEYGILLGDARVVGRGVAAQASRLLLDYAFTTLDLRRVFLHVFSDNTRAIRLYGRIGFVSEGVLRKHAVRSAAAVDVVVMGLLREEWLGRAQ